MKSLVVIVLAVLLTGSAHAQGGAQPQLWMYNVHTKQELVFFPYRDSGDLNVPALWAFSRFASSWRTHRVHAVEPRLFALLTYIQSSYGGRRIELVSGYRGPGEPGVTHSYHRSGAAADIRVAGVPNRTLFDFCRRLPGVGCGFYPNSSHVHVDVRSHSAMWIDPSRAHASVSGRRRSLRARG